MQAAAAQVFGGGLMLGAIFMATDYVTSPLTKLGQIVYGIGCGVISGGKVFSGGADIKEFNTPRAEQAPNLHDVIGRKAGSNPGFDYSPALRASSITWDAKQLDAYLTAPGKLVPGTRMVIAVPDDARRKALIEYLSAP